MRREVKSLYLLARGLETDIREGGKNGCAVLLAVTAMGGTMGFGGDLPARLLLRATAASRGSPSASATSGRK